MVTRARVCDEICYADGSCYHQGKWIVAHMDRSCAQPSDSCMSAEMMQSVKQAWFPTDHCHAGSLRQRARREAREASGRHANGTYARLRESARDAATGRFIVRGVERPTL